MDGATASPRGLFVAVILFSAFFLDFALQECNCCLHINGDRLEVFEVFQRVEDSFVNVFENALWQFNFKQVEILIVGLAASADVDYVELKSSQGRVWNYGVNSFNDALTSSFPLRHTQSNGRVVELGVLTVELSLENVQQRPLGSVCYAYCFQPHQEPFYLCRYPCPVSLSSCETP